jgi:uncharacterized protein
MTASLPKLPDSLRAAAHAHAHAIVSELADISAVVIATVDGFDIASNVRRKVDAPRIAALASSIAAIGEVVSSEASLGASRCVIVETDAGFAVTHRVARADVPLVINVLGGPEAVLAQVKYRAASAALALEQA